MIYFLLELSRYRSYSLERQMFSMDLSILGRKTTSKLSGGYLTDAHGLPLESEVKSEGRDFIRLVFIYPKHLE